MKTIGVIGAGQMGHGIAMVSALKGVEIRMLDANEEALDAALGPSAREHGDG